MLRKTKHFQLEYVRSFANAHYLELRQGNKSESDFQHYKDWSYIKTKNIIINY